jgi:hypothetical protein
VAAVRARVFLAAYPRAVKMRVKQRLILGLLKTVGNGDGGN